MEHVTKCANWNVKGIAHKKEEEDSVLGEKQFEISKIREKLWN